MGIASNINAGLYQHMHAFEVQQLQSYTYILVHHNVKVCSCSRVTIATKQATVQSEGLVCVHKGCSKASNVTSLVYQLQSGHVHGRGAKFGHTYNCMLSRIVCIYRCTNYDKLVRLCSFGSLILWILLRLPFDLLYRLNCHVE